VKYKPLQTIADPVEALHKPEPRIHDYGELGNIHRNQAYEFGDVDEALARADHVFEDLFFYEGNTHLPIEQQASLAAVDPTASSRCGPSTQNPHYLHRQLARVLQMPAAHIRVIAAPNGGGFGGKCDPATTSSWWQRRRSCSDGRSRSASRARRCSTCTAAATRC
jgi:4-hydroxybenzoyl-CoA reductase subunit alpha